MFAVAVHSCGSRSRGGDSGGVAAVRVCECYGWQGGFIFHGWAWIELICCSTGGQ